MQFFSKLKKKLCESSLASDSEINFTENIMLSFFEAISGFTPGFVSKTFLFYFLTSSSAVLVSQGRRQRKISGGEGEGTNEKIKAYGYKFRSRWHTKCSIIFCYA